MSEKITGKNVRKLHGWEEAGGEFYQENYNVDLDGCSKNNIAISTLLPSKQNRFGTNKRTRNGRYELSNAKYWQSFASTHKASTYYDTQFSILPDLSLILTDEERIWEEMLQIKLMPVSMQSKKDMKSNLQRSTKLRLQGLNHIKWKHRKACQKFCLKWTAVVSKLGLWKSSLKKIEGYFGTGVVTYFIFLRWLFFLNCFNFLLILVFIVIPNIFLIHIDVKQESTSASTDACIETKNSTKCFEELSRDKMFNLLDFFNDLNVYKNSLMFYGAYSNKILGINFFGQSQSSLSYNLPLAYIIITMAYFLVTLVLIVNSAALEFRNRLINGKWKFYKYSSLIFSGWDFCIHYEKCGNIKHKSIHNEIKYLLQSKRIESEKGNRSKHYMCNLILKRILINCSVLIILICAAYLVYYLLSISLNQQNDSLTASLENESSLAAATNYTLEIFKNKDLEFNVIYVFERIKHSFYDFMPYIVIVSLNLTLPCLFKFLCKFEKYSPLFVVKICLFRTVFLRLGSLIVLLSHFYQIVIPQSKRDMSASHSSSSSSSCWETFIGQQFFKLVVTDFICHLFVTFCINFPRAFFARHFDSHFAKFIGEQEFEIPKHVLDVVYFQTVAWLGSFYSPFLSGLVALFIFCMFYIKKFQCLVNSKPSNILYGTSRSSSLFMLVLLLSYFLAIVPVLYAIVEIAPSLSCGPFREFSSVWDAPTAAFLKLPHFIKSFILFFGTAAFIIPCFICLIVFLYYFYAISDANKNMIDALKNQLVLEGHDKQFLLNRLSDFLKQDRVVSEINSNSN